MAGRKATLGRELVHPWKQPGLSPGGRGTLVWWVRIIGIDELQEWEKGGYNASHPGSVSLPLMEILLVS